jgi:hypothetical protein
MGVKALGRLFDIGLAVAPVDIDTANAATGKRISMSGHSGLTIVAVTGVGGADDIVFTMQEHTAYTSGTSRDLDVVTEYHIKAETALDNDEAWVKVTQTAGDLTVVGATYGAQQKLIAWYVGADQLSDDATHVSVNAAVTTATAQLFAVLYIPHDLLSQRAPANLPNLLNPGAANA